MKLEAKKKHNLRQMANREILRVLSEYIENNPDVRFSQALSNLNIVTDNANHQSAWRDDFYAEPQEILERITYQ